MVNYTKLSREIEEEYQQYLTNPERDNSILYEKLDKYLRNVIASHIKRSEYVDWGAVEELTQEALMVIAKKGLDSFKQREAKFATYCGMIAKNKALDWVRHANHFTWMEWKEETLAIWEGTHSEYSFGSPEQFFIKQERMLWQMELTKTYLQIFLAWPQKPYRTVGCGFTMILFHKYFPKAKELTSPGWAYGMIEENTVEQAANRFITELQEWFPQISFAWEEDFLDAMEKIDEGIPVSDIIFGSRFQAKDFENWSRRLQPKIKKVLLEVQEKKESGSSYAAEAFEL